MDEIIIQKKFTLLKPAADKCQICAVDHFPDEPHNKDSLYYQFQFHTENGRWPTWADAIAHCTNELREAWTEELKQRGVWDKVGAPKAKLMEEKK